MRLNLVNMKNWLIPVFIVLSVFAVFYPSLQGAFVNWDDARYLTNNEQYRGLSWENIKWIFGESHKLVQMYIPLSWLTWSIDYALWGMNPWGYHLTNIILHSAGATALYFLAYSLIVLACPKQSFGKWALRIGAGFAALLWAIHPIRVESVAWITERKDVLSGLFYILTVLAYLKYVKLKTSALGGLTAKWYVYTLLLFICALLSKPTAISLPMALLILDFYPLRRLSWAAGLRNIKARKIYYEKIPFLFFALLIAIITFVLHKNHLTVLWTLESLSFADRFLIMIYSLEFYIYKFIYPIDLSPLSELLTYFLVIKNNAIQYYFIAFALIACIIILARKYAGIIAVTLFYFFALLPVSGLFQGGPQITADRFTYIPFIGFSVLFGAMLTALWKRYADGLLNKYLFIIVNVIVVSVLLIFTNISVRQSLIWKNSETLWKYVLSLDPDSITVRNNLGAAYARLDNIESALAEYKKVVETVGYNRDTYFFLANAYVKKEEYLEAIKYYWVIVSIDTAFEPAYLNLGVAIFKAGDTQGALKLYEDALSLNPEFTKVRDNLAKMKRGLGVEE